MPCLTPLPGWLAHDGTVSMKPTATWQEPIDLPCGRCLTCRTSSARAWAIRCKLELQDHEHTVWTTLTYDDEHLPGGLVKSDLSGFLKRLRARKNGQRIRFFASGEYGETTKRPHYHAILFGTADAAAIQAAWPYGHSRVDPISDAAIAYVAGYTAKKIGTDRRYEFVDQETGEVVNEGLTAPFILMSRRPGIGATAKKHWKSWRLTAIHNGVETPVPRYLHEAWKAKATPRMVSDLQEEKRKKLRETHLQNQNRDTRDKREAEWAIAEAKHQQQARRRKHT